MSLVFVVLKNIAPQWKKVSQRSCWKWKLLTYFTQHCFYYTDILRRVVRKSARNNPERYCGWFWVHCSSRKFERIAREEMDVCLWVLKESNKSRFSSYSIRNNVLIIYHIAFWDCRVHIFPTTFLEIAVYRMSTTPCGWSDKKEFSGYTGSRNWIKFMKGYNSKSSLHRVNYHQSSWNKHTLVLLIYIFC